MDTSNCRLQNGGAFFNRGYPNKDCIFYFAKTGELEVNEFLRMNSTDSRVVSEEGVLPTSRNCRRKQSMTGLSSSYLGHHKSDRILKHSFKLSKWPREFVQEKLIGRGPC